MYKLVIQDDEGKTTVVPLIRDELTIGRKEGNTIRLTERNVSRAHARLTRSNGTVVIEDLNSYNGIRVNGSRIQGRATIAETDRVQIGDYLIEIRSAAAADAGGSDETQPLERVTAPTMEQQETTQMPLAADSGAALPAAAPEAMALADTDPGRAAQVSNHGRLVVLSTNFPGQEFILDKPSMVIGRTDENDIWLNHRSISRHHAKIVNENGRYSIEDLRSSNGVRVNGEEYGRVELRRADTIDLGHVRLRFVEPGEDFVFGRDAQPVDVVPEGGGKPWLLVGIGAAALIGVIGVVVAMSGGDSGTSEGGGGEGTGTGTAVAGTTPDASTMANTPKIDAAPEKPLTIDAGTTDTNDDKQIEDLLARAAKELKAGRHEQALSIAKQIQELDENNAEAKVIASQASEALNAGADLKLMRTLVKNRDYGAVESKYRSLANTPMAKEAKKLYDRAVNSEYNSLRPRVARAAKEGDCLDANRLINKAKLRPAATKLKRNIKCTPRGTTNGSGTGTGTGAGTGSGSNPTVTVAQQAKELKADIDKYGRKGQYGKAFKACDELIKLGRAGLSNISKCVVYACRGKNQNRAKSYARRIRSTTTKTALQNNCVNYGIKL